jgi:hypothetical protein
MGLHVMIAEGRHVGGHQQAFRTAVILSPKRQGRRQTAVRTQASLNGAKKVNKVVLAYSGGLDTSVILKWLQETYDCEVVTFTADLGQVRLAHASQTLLWLFKTHMYLQPRGHTFQHLEVMASMLSKASAKFLVSKM